VIVPGGGVLLWVESVGHQAHNIRGPARYSRARLTIGLVVQVSAPQAPHDETTDARQHTCPDSGMGWGLTQLVEVSGILSLVSPPVNRQFVTPIGKPPPLAVRLAKALPFQRAQVERRDALAAHDDLHTADGAHAHAWGAVVSGHTARPGRRYDTYATAARGVQGLQALSPHHWPPLGAFIKLPALRVVHDFL